MGRLGDGSHRGQGCQAWTAVGLPPRYPPLRDITCYMGSQCYLSADTGERAPPLTPARKTGIWFTYPEGWKAELTQVAGYIPRWFTHLQMVTHPSINRAWCSITTLIETNALLLSQATTTSMSILLASQRHHCADKHKCAHKTEGMHEHCSYSHVTYGMVE